MTTPAITENNQKVTTVAAKHARAIRDAEKSIGMSLPTPDLQAHIEAACIEAVREFNPTLAFEEPQNG